MALGDLLAGNPIWQQFDRGAAAVQARGTAGMQQAMGLARLMQQQGQMAEQKRLHDAQIANIQAQEKTRLENLQREQQGRAALGALPPGATEEQMIQAITPYSSPDVVLKAKQASMDRKEESGPCCSTQRPYKGSKSRMDSCQGTHWPN